MKSTTVYLRYIGSNVADARLLRVIQKSGTFVYTGPGANNCGLNCDYNDSETVNYTGKGVCWKGRGYDGGEQNYLA